MQRNCIQRVELPIDLRRRLEGRTATTLTAGGTVARDLERWYRHENNPVASGIALIIWSAYWATLIAATFGLIK